MTASERLRQEMLQSAPFTKEEFISSISERIKQSGRASFICDRHIRETNLDNWPTIRMNHEQAAIDFARSEGLINCSFIDRKRAKSREFP